MENAMEIIKKRESIRTISPIGYAADKKSVIERIMKKGRFHTGAKA